MEISVTEAKGRLTALVRRAEAGDEVVLTRYGQAVVKLAPAAAARRRGPARCARTSAGRRRRQRNCGPSRRPRPGFSLRWGRLAETIAVDTSASMAFLPDEPEAKACAEAFATNDRIAISAATVAEAAPRR